MVRMTPAEVQAHLPELPRPADAPSRPQKAPVSPGKPRAGLAAEEALAGQLWDKGVEVVTQHPWGRELEEPRKFVSDIAIPERRLLVEVDGRIHGVHEDKRLRDLERQNLAVADGWHVLRFPPSAAMDGSACRIVIAFLRGKQ